MNYQSPPMNTDASISAYIAQESSKEVDNNSLISNKERYRELCLTNDIPVYSQYWWLDAVCGEKNWDVNFIESDGQIIASWPIYKKKRFFYDIITTPKFTPFTGIWIKYPSNQNYTNKLGYEIDICNSLIETLPKYDYFYQGFNYSFKNWLAFYWKDFDQTVRYSYILEDISNIEQTFAGFSKNKRNNIRKAQKIVEVKRGLSCQDFYSFHKQSLAKEGAQISYSYELFERIYNATTKRGCSEILYAVDEKGEMHSGIFYVWDNVSAYSLISIINPEQSSSNSLSLLFYEAIKAASNKVSRFDFEGSMIKGVEAAYRNFGAKQTPYFVLTKSKSLFINLFSFLFRR